MNNRLAAVLPPIMGLVVAAGVVYAQVSKGNYRPAELGSIEQAAPELSTDSNYQVSAYPVPVLELAAGEGRQEVLTYCNTCHSPRYISMQPPLPEATWEAEVIKMNKTFGAAIPEDATRKILRYLETHYTPDTRKR